ncbi:MAG: sensor histidine kinase [Sedimenticola sp.]
MNNHTPNLHLHVLRWLLIPLALITYTMLIEVYYSSENSTERIQDQMLTAQAESIKEHVISANGDLIYWDLLAQQISNRLIFYKVEGPRNSFVVGYSRLPPYREKIHQKMNKPYYYYGRYRNEEIRMVSLRVMKEGNEINGPMTISVGEFSKARRALVLDVMQKLMIRVALLWILVVMLVWLSITLGLKPLSQLASAIKRRSFDDMRPIGAPVPQEVRQVVDELNNLLQRLEVSMVQQKRFIANASHQLKTPVSALMIQTELALRKDIGTREKDYAIKAIHEKANQMDCLITQLLSLARADAEEQAQQQQPTVDLIAFTKKTTIDWLNDHYAPKIDLGFESRLETLETNANETLLTQLLRNLIDNANNYCPYETLVTVRVYQNNSMAILEVEDNGPGIPANERERVLERFYRRQEDLTGTGLGLAIAKEVVTRHQGNLHLLTPDSGKGLLVRVELPILSAH